MKKLWKRLWNLPPRVYNAISLVLASVLLGIWCYSSSLTRLWLALRDFGAVLVFWFRTLLAGADSENMQSIMGASLPLDSVDSRYGDFFVKTRDSFSSFISDFVDPAMFGRYNLWLFQAVYKVLFYGVYAVLLVYLVYTLLKDLILTDKEKPIGSFSRPLNGALSVYASVMRPTYRACRDFVFYIYDRKLLRFSVLLIWAVNLNLVTIFIEALSFFFYVISCFQIGTLPVRVLHLLLDAILTFRGLPVIAWLVVIAFAFYVVWKRRAMDELRHMDAKNCGFLKTLSYILLIVGRPGLGKTTLMTSFALYFVNIFKQQALDILFELELLFPMFPFGKLRKALEDRMERGLLKNMPTCDLYVDSLRAEFELDPDPCRLFDYDNDLYGMEKNMGNHMEDLFDVMDDYTKAYWLYLCENPSVSNYPIRFDGQFDDSKYLKCWNGDFYAKDPRDYKEKSRYSHIYDKDITRLGRKIDPNGPYNGSFGPGIWTDMEMGKSRGNQNTNEIFRADDDETNPKNDLYVLTGAYIRHANTTVRHTCFCRLISDEQRPETVGASERELCQVITITDKSELKLAVPGMKWFEKIYDRVYKPFKDFYLEYSGVRGDMILTVLLMKLAVSAISCFYKRLYNNYGYCVLTLKIQDGRAFGNAKDSAAADQLHEYYLMAKQVYSDRYLTDADKTFFTKEQLEAKLGLNDYPTYGGLEMTDEEMKAQKDYTIMRMMKRTYGNVNAPGLSKEAKEVFDDVDIIEF